MEIKNKLGDKLPCGEMLKGIMGGDTMEFYSITLSYIGENGIMQSQTFRKATTEELEE